MEKEINAGYVITDRLTVGNSEFVIGQHDTAPAQFVTWQCKKGEKDYFWGHYLGDRLDAVEDLCKRALKEIAYLRTFQQEKNIPEKTAQQAKKKKHEPER
jgi:hypothetical protein